MDFELNEAGRTLLVGSFLILAVVVTSRYVFGHSLLDHVAPRFRRAADGSLNSSLITAVFVGLSFALGLLTEDACAELADRYTFWPYHLTNSNQYSADHRHGGERIESRIQQAVLFDNVQSDPNETTLATP